MQPETNHVQPASGVTMELLAKSGFLR
jgi:riboflavin synthase